MAEEKNYFEDLMRLSLFVLFMIGMHALLAYEEQKSKNWDIAFTSGYIWKHDKNFKKIYGSGVPDLLTVDVFFTPVEGSFGFGVKSSYWEKDGKTSCLHNCTKLKEIPTIFYARGKIGGWLQFYASLGGGAIVIKETSYLGCVKTHTGVGEFEFGFNYYQFKNLYLTGAARALFPRKCRGGEIVDFGGLGLRAGLGVSF